MKLLKSFAFFLAISFCLSSIQAQISSRNILQPFEAGLAKDLVPRDQWKPFPQTPGEWKKLLPASVQISLIKKGEEALDKEFKSIPATVTLEFARTGNRTDYENISFKKRTMLWNMVLAESIEGKGRFTNHIIDGIWSVCEETFWGINAHIGMQKAGNGLPDVQEPIVDLFAAETATLLAWTDYLLGPELERESKLISPRISYEINRRVLTPMVNAHYGYLGNGNHPTEKLNNWAPWVASNYLATNLIMEKDEVRRAEGVVRAMKIMDQYINGLGDDGSTDEGPNYWFAAGACVFDGLNLLSDATDKKINLYEHPFLRKLGAYIYKMHIAGDYFINVADATATEKADGLLLYRFGMATGDNYLKSFGAAAYHASEKDSNPNEMFFRTRILYNLNAIAACETYPAKTTDIPDVWLPNVQVMSSRSDKDLFVATHGGDNGESHNHNDVGDFIIYAGGSPVIIDVGKGTYTARTFSKDRYNIWFNTSAYHNLPVINSYQQSAGREYGAKEVTCLQKGKTSQLSMNIAGAYPKEAGIISWQRIVKMNKSTGVEITDIYNLQRPLKSLTQSFMTVCNVDMNTPGEIRFSLPENKTVTLTYDTVLWNASKEKVCMGIPEEKGLSSSWGGKDIYRILLTAKTLNSKGQIKYLIRY